MRKAFTVSVSAGLLSVAFVAQAETVLWYRFEEGTPGTQMTTATKVVNTAKPGIYEGEAWAHRSGNSCSKDAAYQKYFPYYSAAMGPDFVVYDPVSGETYANAASFHQGKEAFNASADAAKDGAGFGGYVRVENRDLNLNTMTVEAFFRVPAEQGRTGTDMYPIIIRTGGSDSTGRWSLQTRYGQVFSRNSYFKTNETAAKDGAIALASGPHAEAPCVTDGKWHHIAIVADAEKHTNSIYLDYHQLYLSTSFEKFNYDTCPDRPITIGANGLKGGRNFVGDIDEVRISDAALGPEQFLRLKKVAPTPPAVDADTRVYIPFETGDVMPKLVANLNVATNAPAAVVWSETFDQKMIGSREYVANVFSNSTDVSGANVRNGMDGASAPNTGALSVSTNISYAISSVLRVADTNLDYLASDVTVEMFFRSPERLVSGMTKYSQALLACRKMKFLVNQSTGKLLGRAVKPGPEDGGDNYVGDMNSEQRVDDGKWHHVAYVYEKKLKRCAFYVDYALQGYRLGNEIGGGEDAGVKGGYLIGSSELTSISTTNTTATGTQGFNGLIDDIRITQRALRPGEFLRTRPVVIAEAMFDGTTDLTDRNGTIAATMLAKENGTEPSLVAPSPFGAFYYDGQARRDERENPGALSINRGALCWSGAELTVPDFTIEYFAKVGECDKNCNYFRLADEANEMNGTALMLFDNGSSLSFRAFTRSHDCGKGTFKTNSSYNVSIKSKTTYNNNARNHFAITSETLSPTNCRLRVFLNYAQIHEVNLPGTLHMPEGVSLMSFGGRDAEPGYVGTVDSLRITERILDPSEFMRRKPTGLSVLVR